MMPMAAMRERMLDMGMEPYGVGLAIAQTVPATMPHAGGAAAVFLPVRGFRPVRSCRR
jgi:hypothetical protein